MSQKIILENNKKALILALSLIDNKRKPNDDELLVLNQFKGWGGVKSVRWNINRDWSSYQNISSADLEMERDVKDFYNFLKEQFPKKYEDIWIDIQEATNTSFYTPHKVVDKIIEKHSQANPNIESFLEPSAGTGIYVDSVLKYNPNIKRIVAIEKDFITSKILQAKYLQDNRITVINDGFEEVYFSKNEKFDFIASNIPFGDIPIKHPVYDNNITSKIHNFFVYHSAKLLNEGGQMSLISSAGLMNAKNNLSVRKALADEGVFSNLFSLPSNLFNEAGTEVTAHLINFTKLSSLSQHLQDANIDYINTFTNDVSHDSAGKSNSITENQYFVTQGLKSFFGYTRNISTNPYGDIEWSYQYDSIDEFLGQMDKYLSFPSQSITRGIIDSETLKYDQFPNIDISDINSQDQSQYINEFLRFVPSTTISKKSIVGVIKANYKGNIIPIASILRGEIAQEGNLNIKNPVYLLDIYLNHISLSKPSLKFVNSREFKSNYNRFINELKELSKNLDLEIISETPRTSQGESFSEYWAETFKQPFLKSIFREDLGNFAFINEPTVGKHFLYDNGFGKEIFLINDIVKKTRYNFEEGKNEEYDIFKIEKVNLSEEEQKKMEALLYLEHNYKRLILEEESIKKYIADLGHLNENQKSALQSRSDTVVKNLNIVYDNFINKFGELHSNFDFINKYFKDESSILLALEKPNPNAQLIDLFNTESPFIKSDIFSLPIFNDNSVLDIFISPEEAVLKSYNEKGKIDIEYIEQLTGLNWEEHLREQLEHQLIFSPISKSYEFKNLFLSGNIYEKIDECINSNANEEDKEFAIAELEKVVPERVSYHKIGKQFGSRWIPLSILMDFTKEYFNTRFMISWNADTDNLFVKADSFHGSGYSIYTCKSGRKITPENIIEKAFYDEYPIVTYSIDVDGNKETITDTEATRYYKTQIDKIKRAYETHLLTLPESKQVWLEDIYNKKFNAIKLPVIDGSILNFEDMDLNNYNPSITQMYPHQKDAVWKAITNQGGIIDHEVGFGKTVTMCALANKLKKLKIANKPIIMGLNANVAELAHAYQAIYPNSKVLYADPKKEFTPKKRQEFLNKIKTNDWDVVVISHSQFQQIPQNPRIFQKIIEDELKAVEENLKEISNNQPTRKQLSGLMRTQKSLKIKLDKLREQIEKNQYDNVLSFEMLGIDHIIIDESHHFKNLPFQTKHTRTAGLGSGANSTTGQGNMNLLSAIRTIQQHTPNGDYGATFFSGTPISNSLTELYALQKYLTPNVLKKANIQNFDSWASNFVVKSVEFEANMVNEIISKERFRYYFNLPELGLYYNYMSHIMNGRINPDMVQRPKMEERLIQTEQTALQKKFNHKLAKFLETGNIETLNINKEFNASEENMDKAKSLIAMNLSFKASIDMRLVDPSFPDMPNSKINTMVQDVVNTYRQFDEQKGTQIIFMDSEISKKKYSFEELDEKYKNNEFTNVYDDIRYKLIKNGIKDSEIAFIQNWDSKKDLLSQKMNNGEIRVLIGGTNKAGTGLNVQKRLVSVKHLSLPWRPSDLEQRNGRGFRAGNWIAKEHNNNVFDSAIMGTKNTLDIYKFDLLKTKAGFIDQIRSSASNQLRTIDEGELDENSGMNIAELQAQLMGDNTLLDKFKIERQLKELEQERTFIMGEVALAKRNIIKNNERIKELEGIVEKMTEDKKVYDENVQFDKNGTRINKPNYYGLEIQNPKEEAKEIYDFLLKIKSAISLSNFNIEKPIAEMYGFELMAKKTAFEGVYFYIQQKGVEGAIKYDYKEGYLSFSNENAPRSYFINCFNSLNKRLNSNTRMIESLKLENERNEKKTSQVFTKEDELEALRNKLENIEDKLRQRNKTEFSFEKKIAINKQGKEEEFNVYSTIEQLDTAMLKGSFGNSNSIGVGFFSKDNFKIMEHIEQQGSIQIQGYSFLQESDLYIASYFVNNEYLAYNDFHKVLNNNVYHQINDTKIQNKSEKEQEMGNKQEIKKIDFEEDVEPTRKKGIRR